MSDSMSNGTGRQRLMMRVKCHVLVSCFELVEQRFQALSMSNDAEDKWWTPRKS